MNSIFKLNNNLLNHHLIKNQIRIFTNFRLDKKLRMANSKYEYIRENEDYLNKILLNDCYIVIRIDGSKFHQFSSVHNYVKPNDKRALDLMNESALYVVKSYFPNIMCAYGQSDEYSFVLFKNSNLFNRRLNKLNSMLVSAFASAFTYNWSKYFGHNSIDNSIDNSTVNSIDNNLINKNNQINDNLNDKNEFKQFIQLKYPPIFDSRCVLYTTDNEIKDYLKWRQVDCHINNLYNTTFYALTGKYAKWYFDTEQKRYLAEIIDLNHCLTPQEAENKLRGTVSKQKRGDILKGMFNIDYELEMEQFRRGSLIVFNKKDENLSKEKDKNLSNKKDKNLFDEWRECLLSKNKRKLDQFNIDDFINFEILNTEFIKSDYLDNYFKSIDSFYNNNKRLEDE